MLYGIQIVIWKVFIFLGNSKFEASENSKISKSHENKILQFNLQSIHHTYISLSLSLSLYTDMLKGNAYKMVH